MPFIKELVQSLERRMRELSGEIASLERARAALRAGAPIRQRSARPTPRPPAAKSGRRSKAVTPERALEILGTSSDGMATAAIARETGANNGQVLVLLRELETHERVRRTGQRRGTRWHAITDEDRIRERAEELARRPRGRRSSSPS